MEGLYASGQARAIGVSNFSTKKLQDLLSYAKVPPAVDQVECHPVWQQHSLHNLCKSTGIHLSVRSFTHVMGPDCYTRPFLEYLAKEH